MLTPGQTHDVHGFALLFRLIDDQINAFLADRGYDADAIREETEEAGVEAVIPSRRNRRDPILHDRVKYKSRNLVERVFNKLKNWRSVATRYDKKPKTPPLASAPSLLLNYEYPLSTKPRYSTLGFSGRTSFNAIRINRRFIRDTENVSKSSIAMIAEGIKNDSQYAIAERLGMAQVQGDYIDRPMSAGEVKARTGGNDGRAGA